jgi:hypothetical protein
MAFNIDPRFEYHPNGEWSCIDDRTYDGAPDASNMIGWGKTKDEALEDLERLFSERADYYEDQAMEEAERREPDVHFRGKW